MAARYAFTAWDGGELDQRRAVEERAPKIPRAQDLSDAGSSAQPEATATASKLPSGSEEDYLEDHTLGVRLLQITSLRSLSS